MAKWGKISREDRIDLYSLSIKGLVQGAKPIEAYHIYIKLFTFIGDNKDEISANLNLAENAITLALQHPRIASFDSLYNLPIVQELASNPEKAKLFEILEIFTYQNLKDYETWHIKNPDVSNLNHEDCIRKMRYLSICSLALENNEIPYSTLAEAMNINREEIEDWVINAIISNIIDARLDQDNEIVIINSFTRRSTIKDRK